MKSGQLAAVELVNKPFSGIEIIKTDAVSHAPLSGAKFEVKHTNSEKVGTVEKITEIYSDPLCALNISESTRILDENGNNTISGLKL